MDGEAAAPQPSGEEEWSCTAAAVRQALHWHLLSITQYLAARKMIAHPKGTPNRGCQLCPAPQQPRSEADRQRGRSGTCPVPSSADHALLTCPTRLAPQAASTRGLLQILVQTSSAEYHGPARTGAEPLLQAEAGASSCCQALPKQPCTRGARERSCSSRTLICPPCSFTHPGQYSRAGWGGR